MKPANFILDLLRTYGSRGASARHLMSSAELFDFGDNVIRVTLSRLTARGLIENVSRGHYRLAPGSDPVNDFVEEWRLGEARIRPWTGSYLTLYSESHAERHQWALTATGFRQLGEYLWVRPDNLQRQGSALKGWLILLGVHESAILGENVTLEPSTTDKLIQRYDLDAISKRYQTMNAELSASRERLGRLPRASAMTESFRVGGRALQVLAKDPYLPPEIMPTGPRELLWQNMLAYDEIGRQAWAGEPGQLPAESLRVTA